MIWKHWPAARGPATDKLYTVARRSGDDWVTEVWTTEQWHDWLRAQSPRVLALHMSRWQALAARMPALEGEFDGILTDAREAIMAGECTPQQPT